MLFFTEELLFIYTSILGNLIMISEENSFNHCTLVLHEYRPPLLPPPPLVGYRPDPPPPPPALVVSRPGPPPTPERKDRQSCVFLTLQLCKDPKDRNYIITTYLFQPINVGILPSQIHIIKKIIITYLKRKI